MGADLRALGPTIEVLADLPVVVPGNSREHALHELCHAATMGLDFAAEDGWLTNAVAEEALSMGPLGADWNEVWTCAAELRAAAILGWDEIGPARAILGGNISVMRQSVAIARIKDRVWTDAAYQHAVTAILGARVVTEAFLAAFPWWTSRRT